MAAEPSVVFLVQEVLAAGEFCPEWLSRLGLRNELQHQEPAYILNAAGSSYGCRRELRRFQPGPPLCQRLALAERFEVPRERDGVFALEQAIRVLEFRVPRATTEKRELLVDFEVRTPT